MSPLLSFLKTTCLILTPLLVSTVLAQTPDPDLIASLDYGTFQGTYNAQYNISYYKKIPFAAPPTGENRFRAPQPPIPITNGTYDSDQTFDYCPQKTSNGSEDCLYLGLYSRPWTSKQPLRPVVVVFFGGAFIEGGGSFSMPPSAYPILNVSTPSDPNPNDLIFVYPNYRVNAFGFLPGIEIANDPKSDLNPGLLDQQAVLQWTHKYIKAFGGDPDQVSIWGQSAGAGSVVAQVLANGGNTQPPLFHNALSLSPFWPKTYNYDAPQAQAIYDTLANLTGCSGEDSLKCLKTVDWQVISNVALIISGQHTYNTSSYTWAPVIDGDFLRTPLSVATARGEVNPLGGFGMYNQHEGENFIPAAFLNSTNSSVAGTPPFNSSFASLNVWLHGFFPEFSEREIQAVLDQYPAAGEAEDLTYNTTYVRAGLIYRDVVLACPTLWCAEAAAGKKGGSGYVGQYTIAPATHGSDTEWWDTVSAVQVTEPTIYTGYTGAFASFFQTGNPNAHKLTNSSVPGVPELSTGEEFVIEGPGLGSYGFANLELRFLQERCTFWRSVSADIPM